jgi:type I restriction enzyme S subunit
MKVKRELIKLKYLARSFSSNLKQSEVLIEGRYPVYGASGQVGYLNSFGYEKDYIGIIKDGAVGRTSIYPGLSSILGTMSYIVPINENKVDLKFLKYSLDGLNLSKSVGGKVTIPHIYFSDYGNQKIINIEINEQRKISRLIELKLSKIDYLISIQEKEIIKINEYKNSIISESITKGTDLNISMKESNIEWIGSIPKSWKVLPINNCFKSRNQKVSDKEFMPLSVTKTTEGIIPQLDSVAKSDAHESRKLVLKNDFVINSRSDRKLSCGFSKYSGSVSLIYTVLTPNFLILPSYSHYLLKNVKFAEEFYKWGHGIVADLWTTGWNEMKRISVPIPPIEAQIKIVEFLNKNIALIDGLITSKEKKIEKLNEYKTSLINEYVAGESIIE